MMNVHQALHSPHVRMARFSSQCLIETLHAWASFIDSDSLMARATCNCGRVRRDHFGEMAARSPGVVWLSLNRRKKDCVLAAKVAIGLINGSQNLLLRPQNERGGSKLSALVTRR